MSDYTRNLLVAEVMISMAAREVNAAMQRDISTELYSDLGFMREELNHLSADLREHLEEGDNDGS